MRRFSILLGGLAFCPVMAVAGTQIAGEYIEARTCDVYTGPCFANGEMGLSGREAVMAWRVEQGQWNGVELAGLSVAVIANSENTMGDTGVFKMKAGKITSVILVDEKADAAQRTALEAFVRDTAKHYTQHIRLVKPVALKLDNDHLAGKGVFVAGDIAKIETRALAKGDCVCTNEMVYYQPLNKVSDFTPAFSKTLSYTGDGLENQWTTHGQRSAFLATFRR
ncbi:MAG TPA: DUF1326 domain-containing protein [Planctomycetaceae bacterium]|nr:DUF1326 domain-containing protein [Planctomycetaceae bacterium]